VVDGALVQEIDEAENIGLCIETVDGTRCPDVEVCVNKIIEAFVIQWLSAARLTFEARLIKVGETDHILAVTWDHLFSDYASEKIVFRDMWIAYRDLLKRNTSSLSRTPMQYCEYALWQHDNYSQWVEQHGSFWKEHLAGISGLQLQSDAGHRDLRPIKDRIFDVSFGLPLSRAVHQLAQSERILPSLVVFATCISLLSAWAHQRNFVIPFYVYGRHSSRQFQIVGYLAHPLPLKIEINETDTFVDLLHRISDEFVSASHHLSNGKSLREAPNPFEGPFVQWFDSPPNPCDSMVPRSEDMNNNEVALSVEAFPLTFSGPQEPTVWDQVPLSLTLWNSPQGIMGYGMYRTDLFTHETIRLFLGELRSALASIVDDPLTNVSALSRRC